MVCRILPAVLLSMSLIFMMQGCRDNDDMSEARYDGELQKLCKEATDAARKKQYEVSDSLGKRLYQLADIEDNDIYRIKGLICMSYSLIDNKGFDQSLHYLKKAESLLAREKTIHLQRNCIM